MSLFNEISFYQTMARESFHYIAVNYLVLINNIIFNLLFMFGRILCTPIVLDESTRIMSVTVFINNEMYRMNYSFVVYNQFHKS